MRLKTVLAAMPLVIALATIAIAGSGADGGPMGGRRAQWLQQKLGLSDDQMQQLQATVDANKSAEHDLGQKLGQAMADFRQSALNGDDASTLASKKAAAQALFGQQLDLRAKNLQQIGKILTPDQRTAFANMNAGPRGGRWHRKSPTPAADGGL